MWLTYHPGGMIQERDHVYAAYEVWAPELNLEVGRVEAYHSNNGKGPLRWRTLDHWKCDWRDGFTSREKAAQDLCANSPRAKERIAARQQRVEGGEYRVPLPADGHNPTKAKPPAGGSKETTA